MLTVLIDANIREWGNKTTVSAQNKVRFWDLILNVVIKELWIFTSYSEKSNTEANKSSLRLYMSANTLSKHGCFLVFI